MLTICIPVYNFDVTPLVNELAKQAAALEPAPELVVIDDCSNQETKKINREVAHLGTYVELGQNVGRSKIRNLFLGYAQGDYLLFLDCDSLVGLPGFLANYLETTKTKPDVVYGGRIYDPTPPARERMLRWKYGTKRESQPVETRKKHPNKSFMTNNFLIRKEVFEKIKFDERITQYGHEDTLFGFALKKEGIQITHIDNPVVNGDIENNLEYLRKSNEGVQNLANLSQSPDFDRRLIHEIALLHFYTKSKNFSGLVYTSFWAVKPLIIWLLSKGYICLFLFDFYKLGMFIEYKKSKKTKF